MLNLENQNVKITNVNPRAEKHGEENKLACDIHCEIKVGNEFLIPFHPELRTTLFRKGDQSELPLDDDTDRLTALKFPQIKHLRWTPSNDKERFKVVVDYGMGGESDVVLTDCKVNNFGIHPQEGGSVFVNFRIQGYPSQDDIGKLCGFIQGETKITIALEESQQMDLAEPKAKGRGRSRKKEMSDEEKREGQLKAISEVFP